MVIAVVSNLDAILWFVCNLCVGVDGVGGIQEAGESGRFSTPIAYSLPTILVLKISLPDLR